MTGPLVLLLVLAGASLLAGLWVTCDRILGPRVDRLLDDATVERIKREADRRA